MPIDEIDKKIIEQLQADGRMQNTAIARRVGVSESTVRKRIDQLVKDQVIVVGAWPDPLKIGFHTYLIIQLSVDRTRIDEISQKIADMPEVLFLGVCSGATDLHAGALFRSVDHMYEFMVDRLGEIPGINKIETNTIMRVLKRDYQFKP